MAKYYKRNSNNNQTSVASYNPVRFANVPLAKQSEVDSVIEAQNNAYDAWRRVVYRKTMGGRQEFYVSNVDDTDNAIQKTHTRTVGVSKFRMTPGCQLRIVVSAAPSGRVSNAIETLFSSGAVRVQANFDYVTAIDGDVTLQLPGSSFGDGDAFAAEPNTLGGCLLEDNRSEAIINPYKTSATQNVDQLCNLESMMCELTITERQAARVYDIVIYEEPIAFWLEADSSRYSWVHQTRDDTGSAFPATRNNSTSPDGDPRGGQEMIYDLPFNQRRKLCPLVLQWCPYNEWDGSDYSTGLSMPEPSGDVMVNPTLDPYINILDETYGYNPNGAGFKLGAAGYARKYIQNSDLVTGLRYCTIPVIARVYINDIEASGGVNIKLQSGPGSYIHIHDPDAYLSAGGWYEARGYLQVGLNPETSTTLQVFASMGKLNAGANEIRAVVIEQDGTLV